MNEPRVRALREGGIAIWRFVPRGGYGFTLHVPVRILRLRDSRATIRIEGTDHVRTVRVSTLSEPTADARASVTPPRQP